LLTVSAGRLSILKFAFKSFTVAQIIDANPEMPMNEMFSDYTTNHIFPELRHSAAQFCPEHTRKILPKNRERISLVKVDILVSVSKGDNHLRCCLISKIEMPESTLKIACMKKIITPLLLFRQKQ